MTRLDYQTYAKTTFQLENFPWLNQKDLFVIEQAVRPLLSSKRF